MFEIGNQKSVQYSDFNKYFANINGSIPEKQAKLLLAQFFRHNIGTAIEFFSGVRLLPVQEIILKAMFNYDLGIVVAGRGFSKSFLLSVFCIFYPIFYPGNSVCIISANFRSSRRILEASEKIIKDKRSSLLRSSFPNELKRANDLYRLVLPNGSEVFALPLSGGQGMRGARAQAVLVDEGLLINKDVQNSIIRPFLTARANIGKEQEIRQQEDYLITQGLLTEADRIRFPKNKYMVFSSASYDFEYLCQLYNNYVELIKNPPNDQDDPPRYFAARLSYEVMDELPDGGILDRTQIEAAKAEAGVDSDYFKREYKALFSSSSDAYFNIRKMHECTIPYGDKPCIELIGDTKQKYLLAIDPSYSSSAASDYFAMGLYALNVNDKKMVLVHSYAKAGGEIKDHFLYLVYLLCNFEIIWVVIDDSGSEFISGFNESLIAKNRGIRLNQILVPLDKDSPEDYNLALQDYKLQYNTLGNTIVYGQRFSASTIRKMNEHLKNQIEAKKIWFASRLDADDKAIERYKSTILNFGITNKSDGIFDIIDFIDNQNDLINQTKIQTALIEVKVNPLGTLSYDLPSMMKRNKDANRPRKDNYTTLLMAATSASHYFRLMATEQKSVEAFIPILLR